MDCYYAFVSRWHGLPAYLDYTCLLWVTNKFYMIWFEHFLRNFVMSTDQNQAFYSVPEPFHCNALSTPPTRTKQNCLVLSMSAVWTELATSEDCRRQKISKLNTFCFIAVLSCLEMRCELSFVLRFLDPCFQFATIGLWFSADNALRTTTDKAHITTWCKNCIATASDSATTLECKRCCSTTFWARSGHRSRDATPICRRNLTKLFSLKYIEDYWKLSWLVANPVHSTDTDKTRQSCLVLSVSVVWTRRKSSSL